ncbi:hypothetical protein C0581_05250 [Candidatus Parcubacteria bacterium]|nr:MAG: hypothetical protein C0581_05250 [Candidatus Parcubacteria bacterium]
MQNLGTYRVQRRIFIFSTLISLIVMCSLRSDSSDDQEQEVAVSATPVIVPTQSGRPAIPGPLEIPSDEFRKWSAKELDRIVRTHPSELISRDLLGHVEARPRRVHPSFALVETPVPRMAQAFCDLLPSSGTRVGFTIFPRLFFADNVSDVDRYTALYHEYDHIAEMLADPSLCPFFSETWVGTSLEVRRFFDLEMQAYSAACEFEIVHELVDRAHQSGCRIYRDQGPETYLRLTSTRLEAMPIFAPYRNKLLGWAREYIEHNR